MDTALGERKKAGEMLWNQAMQLDFAPVVYHLKVVLQGISPMLWRRLLVQSENTIADLHYVIQIALGWNDEYLHQFIIHHKRYEDR